MYKLLGWDVFKLDRREQCKCLHELLGGDVLESDGCKCVCFMSGGYVLGRLSCDKCEYVCVMPRRDAFKHIRRDLFCRVHGLPDQHVFRGGSVGVPAVSGERDVGGRQHVARILLLQERVCACGRLVHVSHL